MGSSVMRDRGKQLMSWKFFSDSLDDVVIWAVPDLGTECHVYGCCWGLGNTTRIAIDPFPDITLGERASEHIAATLLHEMCHAIRRKYSCSNVLCGDGNCVRDISHRLVQNVPRNLVCGEPMD